MAVSLQSDTDMTSQWQSDRPITVMYLNVCVCVLGVGVCCDPWFGSIVWPSELTDGKPEPDFNTEILPCLSTDRQRMHRDDPQHHLQYLTSGERSAGIVQISDSFRPAEV